MKTIKIAVEDDLLGNIEEKYTCWLNGNEMENQYKTEKGDNVKKIGKGIRFFH